MNACPFCQISAERIAFDDRFYVGLWDGYPVSDGHLLLVPKRHVPIWGDLTSEEQHGLSRGIGQPRQLECRHGTCSPRSTPSDYVEKRKPSRRQSVRGPLCRPEYFRMADAIPDDPNVETWSNHKWRGSRPSRSSICKTVQTSIVYRCAVHLLRPDRIR